MARILNLSHFMTDEAQKEERNFLALTAKTRKLQNSSKNEYSDETTLMSNIAETMVKVAEVREKFDNRIIRRELMSPGEGGAGTITGMKLFWEETAWLSPSASEDQQLSKIEDIIKADIKGKEEIGLTFQSSVRHIIRVTATTDFKHEELLPEAAPGGNQCCCCSLRSPG